jgi:hypothetical protein
MLRRLILTLTLAFLFGLGQQGALVHQLSHVDDLAPASQQQDKSAHSVCDQCLAYSTLAHALANPYFSPPLAESLFALFAEQESHAFRLTHVSYQARAPPQFI